MRHSLKSLIIIVSIAIIGSTTILSCDVIWGVDVEAHNTLRPDWVAANLTPEWYKLDTVIVLSTKTPSRPLNDDLKRKEWTESHEKELKKLYDVDDKTFFAFYACIESIVITSDREVIGIPAGTDLSHLFKIKYRTRNNNLWYMEWAICDVLNFPNLDIVYESGTGPELIADFLAAKPVYYDDIPIYPTFDEFYNLVGSATFYFEIGIINEYGEKRTLKGELGPQ